MLVTQSDPIDENPSGLARRISCLYVVLFGANVAAWLWAFAAFQGQPALLSTALLAYTFGLRHAVDGDHIAAIDNVTRKLMQMGRSPLGAGVFFSLGHSTVVVGLTVAVAFAAAALTAHFDDLKEVGSIVGTGISATFLFGLAVANLCILASVVRTFRAIRRGEPLVEANLNSLLGAGFIARLFRPLFKLVSHSWHLYPVGFLFGLGFDTATEVALLGLSAAQVSHGLSLSSVLALPMLFAAGMTLVDATDGVLMLGAYRWALVRPMRKLYYNIAVTLVSVVVAVLIGGIEVLGLLQDKLGTKGAFWSGIRALEENPALLGCSVIGVFVISWMVSIAMYRTKR
jgi:nickel/cobalt transporter (NiCoT) family protein